MEEWRLILDLECQEPHMAMAVEEAISKTVEGNLVPNTFRIWRGSNSVIIGQYQCIKAEINPASCLMYKTKVVRRFTGGGAVYHDCGNLNFSLSIRREKIESSSNIFKKITSAIAKNFKKNMGLNVIPGDRSIEIEHKKISGLSGRVTKRLVFVHGCLLVQSNISVLNKVLKLTGERKWMFVPSIPKEVTNIETEIGRKIDLMEVVELLNKAIKEEFSVTFFEEELTNNEHNVAVRLNEKKYSRFGWLISTCYRCPEFKIDKDFLKNVKKINK